MLIRLLFCITSFFFCSVLAQAQAYEPGVLVRSNGDTLRGEIENGFWNEPPTFIRFRPAPGSPSQLFDPAQLRAVSFTGGRYFRYETLPIDYAAETDIKRLQRGNSTDVQLKSLLAEVLIEGPCSMLRVATLGSVHYLLRRPGHEVLDLSARKYLITAANGSTLVADGNNYRSQLALFFIDCSAASKIAATADFTPQTLASVVQAYNQECDPAHQPGRSLLAQAVPRRRTSLQGGVLAGIRYNAIKSLTFLGNNECSDCRVYPFGGFYADLLLPNRTSAVYGELSLSNFRNRRAINLGFSQPGYYTYEALLSTARIGLRRFVALPHEQQLLLSLSYEWNTVWQPKLISGFGPATVLGELNVDFARPTLLPGFGLGWRSNRFTFSADAQLYRTYNAVTQDETTFFGRSIVARVSTAYRLSRNHDVLAR